MGDLTLDRVRELFMYRDGKLYWRVSHRRVTAGEEAGCITHSGYRRVRLEGKSYYAHRIVYALHHGAVPTHIDHIDGNRSNNQIENLRAANASENRYNSKRPHHDSTGVKGVFLNRATGNWRVCITINKVRKCFGTYNNLELAELVATEARNKFHGEFARHA